MLSTKEIINKLYDDVVDCVMINPLSSYFHCDYNDSLG